MTKTATKNLMAKALNPMDYPRPLPRFKSWPTVRSPYAIQLVQAGKCCYCEQPLTRKVKANFTFPEASIYEGRCKNQECRAELSLVPPMRLRGAMVVLLNGGHVS